MRSPERDDVGMLLALVGAALVTASLWVIWAPLAGLFLGGCLLVLACAAMMSDAQ